jgi:hypothetical protein
MGMAKAAFGEAASYAAERKQFGRAIGEFGAIKEKLADMVAAVFAAESVIYRVAGLLDARIGTLEHGGPDYYERYQKAIEEYAVECAIAKVFSTEQLDFVVDEAVQIHGGYGYISEYAVERYYRDSRIQRIFEGTNEINRILIPTMLFRKAESSLPELKGKVAAALKRSAEALTTATTASGPFGRAYALVENLKQLFLVVLGDAEAAKDSQEVLMAFADLIIDIFALESALLRADKLHADVSATRKALLEAVIQVIAFDLAARFQVSASRGAAYAVKGARGEELQNIISCFTRCHGEGLLEAKQLLADTAKDGGKYVF